MTVYTRIFNVYTRIDDAVHNAVAADHDHDDDEDDDNFCRI